MSFLRRFLAVELAVAIVKGRHSMPWWRKGSKEEDEVVAKANEVLLGAASDADFVKRVSAQTGSNLRDQLTVEQAEALEKEVRLRRWGFGRN